MTDANDMILAQLERVLSGITHVEQRIGNIGSRLVLLENRLSILDKSLANESSRTARHRKDDDAA